MVDFSINREKSKKIFFTLVAIHVLGCLPVFLGEITPRFALLGLLMMYLTVLPAIPLSKLGFTIFVGSYLPVPSPLGLAVGGLFWTFIYYQIALLFSRIYIYPASTMRSDNPSGARQLRVIAIVMVPISAFCVFYSFKIFAVMHDPQQYGTVGKESYVVVVVALALAVLFLWASFKCWLRSKNN